MTAIHVNHDDLAGGSVVARAVGWLGAVATSIHQAIAAARLEQLENELVLHRRYGDDCASDRDAARYPQRPMILSDKWDF
jgi:hypothetical protein